jgi:hypothetical protein
MTAAAIPVLTRDHAQHTEYVAGCGVCRFDFEARHALPGPGGLPRYWDVTLHMYGQTEQWGTDIAGAWRELRACGFVETYWNWRHADYLGGNNVYGTTQQFSVRHEFRSPVTGGGATLSFKEEQRR